MATVTIPERGVASDDTLTEMVNGCILEKDVGDLSTLIAFRLARRMNAFEEDRKRGPAVAETSMRILSEADTLTTELLPGWSAPVADVIPPITRDALTEREPSRRDST